MSHHDGSKVAAATMRGVMIWDTSEFPSTRIAIPFMQNDLTPMGIQFLNERLVVCFENGTIGLIDVATKHLTTLTMGTVDSIESVSINSEHETVAFISNGTPMVFDMLSHQLVTLEEPPSSLIGIEAVNSGSILLFGEDGVVYSTQY